MERAIEFSALGTSSPEVAFGQTAAFFRLYIHANAIGFYLS
jgi:hypothetical protein